VTVRGKIDFIRGSFFLDLLCVGSELRLIVQVSKRLYKKNFCASLFVCLVGDAQTIVGCQRELLSVSTKKSNGVRKNNGKDTQTKKCSRTPCFAVL
jgi:hypothetical protein